MPANDFVMTRLPRAHRLATAFATALGFALPVTSIAVDGANSPSAPAHAGSTVPVTNCNDSGAGSLRDAVAAAASGDTVDLTHVGCSVITLTSGQIEIPQDDLVLKYAGDGTHPTISTNGAGRVLHHTGHGTLEVSGLTLSDGKYVGNFAFGGCVYSSGSVYLLGATISNCTAQATESGSAHGALGGGVFAQGEIRMLESIVSGNVASTTQTNVQVFGGGLYSAGGFTFSASTITGNQTQPATNGLGFGGGGLAVGTSYVNGCTIDNNQANVGAGLALYGTSATVVNSTFSANNAGEAALSFDANSASLENSTVAFNTAGALTAGVTSNYALTMESSIVADNHLFGGGDTEDVYATVINGSHNLVLSGSNLPPDTIMDDPMLQPLIDNGGPTLTHALAPGSPAIDRGSNTLNLAYDQRGVGYTRVAGAAPDIGAFELQTAGDSIFVDGFDP